jgi:hypothetical protein
MGQGEATGVVSATLTRLPHDGADGFHCVLGVW